MPADDTIGLPGIGMTITYARLVSRTLDDGVSRKSQEDDHDRICADHGLPPIVQRFYDEAITGMVAIRPGYAAMQTFGNAWPGCTIVVERVDRVARSLEPLSDFAHFLIRNDIKLFDNDGEITPAKLLAICSWAAMPGKFK